MNSRIARRMPWWAVLVLGLVCLVLGAWLLAEPFGSLSVLHWLIVAALIVSGFAELVSAPAAPRPALSRLVGIWWIAVGIVATAWPGITILALATAVGVALVAGGVVEVVATFIGNGGERFIPAVSGLTNVIVGALALTWPAATVLVLAVVFGLRTIIFGVGQFAVAFTMRRVPARDDAVTMPRLRPRWPRWLRLVGSMTALTLALGGVVVSVAIHRAAPREPGPFYSAPTPLPDGLPGTIIRTEIIDGFHKGATTYRVLYKSTGFDGAPTAVSGIIVVPRTPPPSLGRKVIGFAHGTVGVAPNCSPSLQGARASLVYEGLDDFLAAGYVVAATDYQGLGTRGPHPYLVGPSEAMNVLDSVRAAHNLAAANAGTDFAVWGHSQGGHASLFTGQLASSYAPELHLVGVAAGAPPANLVELFEVNVKTTVGKILMAMAMQSWARVYDDASLDQIVTPASRSAIARIADHCLYDPAQILASVPSSLLLGFTFIATPPWQVEPWKTILAKNRPGSTPTRVPMLITQGSIDPIIAPDVTSQFVAQLCANGETVDYRVLPGVAHLDAGHVAAPAVATWITERFAGEPAQNTCVSP